MIKRKGKFLSFLFSLMPGAGEMYLGFMKLGASIMAAFFGVIFLSTWLNIGPFAFLLPIIWFYGFFDTLNKCALSDEEFYSLEDHFLFNLGEQELSSLKLGHYKPVIAVALIVIGVYMLLRNFFDFILVYLPDEIRQVAYSVIHTTPQIIFAVIIILVGVRLIMGKKEELENHTGNGEV